MARFQGRPFNFLKHSALLIWSHPSLVPLSQFSIPTLHTLAFVFLAPTVWNTGAMASLVAQMIKNLPATQETQVLSLSQEDPLKRECNPLQYSCVKNPMDRGACPWGCKESYTTERLMLSWCKSNCSFALLDFAV